MALHATDPGPLTQEQDGLLKRLRELGSALAATPDLRSLGKMILETICQVLAIEKASLFLLNEEKGGCSLIESIQPPAGSNPPSHLTKEDPLLQFLMKSEGIVVRDEVTGPNPSPNQSAVSERMALLDVAVTIPLTSKGGLIGMVNLSQKPSGEPYTPEDTEWLSVFATLWATALENRTLSEELKKSKSHIQRADRLASLGTLTASLAHELRNPLVAIKTFTQLLPERFEDEEFRNHFLQIVSGEVDRISTLINELLEFARPSDPRMEAEDVNAILDSILFLVSTGTKKKHIDIIKNLSPNLPSIPIDREQIKQVFLNVLINAIEATDEGGKIYVKTRPVVKSNGEPHIQIEVADTGCGIPAEFLGSIFHPFFTTKHKGSGLGLSISNQIVQDHKGTIDVESQLNKGATFYINLPLHPEGLSRKRDSA